jgi:hypothetical protein
MNATLIVFIPAEKGRLSAEQAVAGPITNLSQRPVDLLGSKATSSAPSLPDEMTPQFWTWFIQNPRSNGA